MNTPFNRFQRWEPDVHAWESIDPLRFIQQGLKIAVKDNFNSADFPTQMGSGLWRGFTPGNDARVVAKLRAAGAVIVGKTVTAEFGVHHPGKTKNPHDLKRTPGTSSSGSAAAVACGMVPVALGTQTAGSIIRPASYCGVYGFKPSYGLLPRTGILKTTDTLDTVGFFVEEPKYLRPVLNLTRVHGPNYPQTARLHQSISRPLTVGILHPPCERLSATSSRASLQGWGDLVGARDAGWPEFLNDAPSVHRTIYHRCLAYYFQRELATPFLVSDIFLKAAQEGERTSLKDYQAAIAEQVRIAQALDDWMEQAGWDILATLSAHSVAPKNETKRPEDTCAIWTLCGVPVVSAPAFVSPEGLPFGLQLIARKHHDYQLIEFIEDMARWGKLPLGPNPRLY